MGGKILKDGAAISLCAVTECRVLEPQKKRERENETDALFAQHKSLWLTAKYLFLFTCTQAGIHNFFFQHRDRAGGWGWIVRARFVGVLVCVQNAKHFLGHGGWREHVEI